MQSAALICLHVHIIYFYYIASFWPMEFDRKRSVFSNLFYFQKVTNAYRSLKCSSLRDMLQKEQNQRIYRRNGSGSVGLVWLCRTFQFVSAVLERLHRRNDADSMYPIVIDAYDATLTRHHNRVVRNTFRVS